MSSAPTSRQREIAEFLHTEFQRRGMMPTRREIAAKFGFASENSVRTHLRLMEKKGMISLLPGKARGLKLAISVTSGIQILGDIAAGKPREAIQEPDEILPLSRKFFSGAELFGLRVKGDSMRDAGILSGDIAIINRQQNVCEGEVAAVLFDNEATLKFFFRSNSNVVLRGANPTFRDIVISPDDSRDLRILGKYVGLVRKHGGLA